ncbi:MAG TPA: S8 family serine peptidase [Pyrinomonadaceae bacterium]|nr:S8 family serine peptidase [Pyrinomonadaceae bacterium]
MKVFIKAQNEVHVPTVLKMHKVSEAVVSEQDNHVVIADLPEESINELRAAPQFEVYDDIEFQPAPPLPSAEWWRRQIGQPLPLLAPVWHSKTQADVMDHNRASDAWAKSRGEGVTIAIVDTGTDGSMPEFINRSPHSYAPSFSTPWSDTVGHGTMCAGIACGSIASGGRYSGVAPEATLLTARSTLFATDLYLIYQHLLKLKHNGEFPRGIVVSNSYGIYTCTPPTYPQGHPYVDLVKKCIEEGMVFVFAGGNNHAFGFCNHPEVDEHPNTIWAVNSIDEVITVGTVDWNESNDTTGGEHANSSRGPGQWSTRQDKPDVVAPTYGEVIWGGGYQKMEWWGTSGACPQVAGLAALLLSRDASLTPAQIRTTIRSSARTLVGKSATCVGDGIIDCEAAIQQVP